ncbi:hypothetical protein EBU99_06580 [bacterium]|nr:hypothetical protein [bacterium]
MSSVTRAKFRTLVFLSLLLSLKMQVSAQAGQEWKQTLSDEGIVVFKRLRGESPYEEVRAQALMNGRVEDFVPYFSDPVNYKKWVYGSIETKQVTRLKDFDFVFYGTFKIPWPFENRELFSRVELNRDAKSNELTAKLSDSSSQLPVSDGLVRVSKFESLWTVKPVDDKQVNLTIEMYVEPGGKLPPFIVNLVLSRIQLWSIKNLRKQIAQN